MSPQVVVDISVIILRANSCRLKNLLQVETNAFFVEVMKLQTNGGEEWDSLWVFGFRSNQVQWRVGFGQFTDVDLNWAPGIIFTFSRCNIEKFVLLCSTN